MWSEQAAPQQTRKLGRIPSGHIKHPTTYLEEGEANIVFEDDAAYTPHITRLRPAQLWVGMGRKRYYEAQGALSSPPHPLTYLDNLVLPPLPRMTSGAR